MHEQHDHDHGLAHDLQTLLRPTAHRRLALRWLLGAGTTALLGCGGGGDDSGSNPRASGTSTATGSGATASCSVIPEETAGPYPGDGSNSSNGSIANALALSGIVRSDIRSSIGGASSMAAGVPLTIELRLVNTAASCADLSGYAIYLWHCDRDGKYSMYSTGVAGENYLRGVQSTDDDGVVRFTIIFPACYAGRMPHVHFEVYRSANVATQYSNKLKTSQLAFPMEVCQAVYNGAAGYSASVSNLGQISFASDNVFSDGVALQLASVTGDIVNGYMATLTVGISA